MRWLVLSVVCLSASARGDGNDLSIERLIGRPSVPGRAPVVTIATQSAYIGLASQLGVVLAPRSLQSADCLGWSGFALAIDGGFTQIDRSSDAWQLGARSVSGTFLSVVGAVARKGIWLGIPSLEISFGGHTLDGSGMFTLELGAKLALVEGTRGWRIPSIAIGASVAQLFGSPELGLTIVDVGVIVSKRFIVRDVLRIDPFIGIGAIVSFATSRLVDTTPDIDAYRQGPMPPDAAANVQLPDPGTLPRARIHAGARLQASLFTLVAQIDVVPCAHCGADDHASPVDASSSQVQLSIGAGVTY